MDLEDAADNFTARKHVEIVLVPVAGRATCRCAFEDEVVLLHPGTIRSVKPNTSRSSPKKLEAIAIESKRTIEIDEFVPKKEIDELYLNSPYYIVPDGEVGQQAFAVIREAIRKEGMVALARVVFTSREHVIALEPRGKGLLGMTLRYPYEVRKEDEYFDEIEDEKIPKDMMELASHIVETKSGHFKPEEFEDHYEDALKELLKKKQAGEKIEAPRQREPAKVISLMDALRRSVDAERDGGRGQSERRPARTPKKAGRSSARQNKAG
jgi:DNA end-binding protein Ku